MSDNNEKAVNEGSGQDKNELQENMTQTSETRPDSGEQGPTYRDFLNISYVILTIAAIFLINAMETGSYRTPWPLALGVTLLGAGLFAYALNRKKQEGH